MFNVGKGIALKTFNKLRSFSWYFLTRCNDKSDISFLVN